MLSNRLATARRAISIRPSASVWGGTAAFAGKAQSTSAGLFSEEGTQKIGHILFDFECELRF